MRKGGMFLTRQTQKLNVSGDLKKPVKEAGTEKGCITEGKSSWKCTQPQMVYMGQRLKSCRGFA